MPLRIQFDRSIQVLFPISIAMALASFLMMDFARTFYMLKFVLPVLCVVLMWSQGQMPRLPAVFLGTWWLWILTQTASVFVTANIVTSVLVLGSYMLFLFYTVTMAKFHSDRDYDVHAGVMLAVAIVICVSLLNSNEAAWTAFEGRRRFQGSFINPNFLGQFAAMGIYSTWLWVSRRRWRQSLRAICGVLISVPFAIPLYLSDSRGAALFLALALVVPALWKRKGLVLWIGLTSVLVGTLMLAGTNLNLDSLTSYRFTRWEERLNDGLTGDRWFGKGMAEDQAVDNAFAIMFSQAGIVGGSAGLLFAAATTGMLLTAPIGPTAKGLWIAWLTYSLIEGMWYSLGNPLSVYVWTLMLTAKFQAETAKPTRELLGLAPQL